ncbi:hypothetical protein ACQ4LE_006640 [Meloidogyne hapla]
MTEDLPMDSPSSPPQIPPAHKEVPTVPRSVSPIPPDLRHRVPAIFGGHPPSFMERKRSSIVMGQRSVDLLMEQPGEPMPRFVIFIIRCYRRWGYFIADHGLKAIIICVLISLIGLYFVLTTKQQNDITGYSPYGARARTEFSRYQEFFSHDGPGITVYIFALAKDGGNMLREKYLNETVEILNLANENVTLQQNGHKKSFAQFCRSFCKINEPVRAFYNGFRHQQESIALGNKPNSRINLNYPMTQILGNSFTLQQSFFGIELYNETNEIEDKNNFNLTEALIKIKEAEEKENKNNTNILSKQKELKKNRTGRDIKSKNNNLNLEKNITTTRITNMKSVKMVVLQFRAEHEHGWTSEIVKSYEMAMVKRFGKEYKSERLKLYVLSTTYVEEEMVRAGISMVPYLSVGFLVMVACSVFFVLNRAIYMHQNSPPKIFLAIAICFLPFMSCTTALGLMFICGMRFASILCVIPFLVLSIGVDSSYLMNHEWQSVIKHCREQPNRKNLNVGYRISQVLSEVGPAILISMLTNVFADGIGAITSSPEITLLCVGNLISMIIAFIFQMTCYAGLMSLVGRYEISLEKRERREIQESIRKAISNGSTQINNNSEYGKHPSLNRQQSKFHEHTKHYISKTITFYIKVISKRVVALFVIFIYFVYVGFSIWGITRMNINLTTQKLFTEDSPLLELDKLRVKYQVPHFMMATVFICSPGNLSNPERLGKMNNFVRDMEQLNGTWGRSWGPVGTQYFVRDFVTFEANFEGDTDPDELEAKELENAVNENSDSSDSPQLSEIATIAGSSGSLSNKLSETPTGPFKEEDLSTFLNWPEFTQWSGFIKLDNKSGHLERFFFTTGYHGEKLEVWTERGKLLKEWRAVVDKYSPDFDASVFHEDAVFLDLIDNMPTDTWQSVLGTLVCMAFVCFAFLSSMFTVIFASSCVLSICCGILGILSWWSIDLDPITMAAMIISIGFSVDIPAHVSYHYYQASIRELNATPEMKLVNCLSSVAFPALQAALSTIFCVCSLLFVKLYMAEVFVKTMVLCVVLCNLHGLLFLPAFLIVFDPVVYSCRQRISKKESGSQESSLRENGLINEKKKKFNQNGKSTENGLNKTINNAKQSTVTDRPNLERFHSIELEGGDRSKQEGNEQENNNKDTPKITSKSTQKIDDTSH